MHSWGFALRDGEFAETKEGTRQRGNAREKGRWLMLIGLGAAL